jgi:hypothetical protein
MVECKCDEWIVEGENYSLPYEKHSHQDQRKHLVILLRQAAESSKKINHSHIPYHAYAAMLTNLAEIAVADERQYIPGYFVTGISGVLDGIRAGSTSEMMRLDAWCANYCSAEFSACDRHMHRALKRETVPLEEKTVIEKTRTW